MLFVTKRGGGGTTLFRKHVKNSTQASNYTGANHNVIVFLKPNQERNYYVTWFCLINQNAYRPVPTVSMIRFNRHNVVFTYQFNSLSGFACLNINILITKGKSGRIVICVYKIQMHNVNTYISSLLVRKEACFMLATWWLFHSNWWPY